MSRSHLERLFARLVDDAAVFPPGLAPVDRAVSEHLALRQGPYAAHLGPLLLPATAAAEVAALAARDERAVAEPLAVGLIVRPGSPLEPLVDGVELLADEPSVSVSSVEVGWSDGWRRTLELGVPVVVEVGLGIDQEAGLDDIAHAVDHDSDVNAKFRTGRTPAWAWPDEAALGAFLDAAVLRGLSFKLTGGLHHVVRGAYGAGDEAEPMHGLLNVLVATHEALDGAEASELAEVLAETDAERLVERVTQLDEVSAARARASFAAYGCCGVLDPLTELEALRLIRPTH